MADNFEVPRLLRRPRKDEVKEPQFSDVVESLPKLERSDLALNSSKEDTGRRKAKLQEIHDAEVARRSETFLKEVARKKLLLQQAVTEKKSEELAQKVQGAEVVASNPVAASKIVNESDAPEAVKKQVKTDLQSPEKISQSLQRSEAAKEQGKAPSIKDQFIESLTFFLPQIGGAIIGGLLGGSDAAIAGADEGGKLGKSFRDFKVKQQELALEEEKIKGAGAKTPKSDITPDFVLKDTGEPVFSTQDANGNAIFVNQFGKQVDARQLQSVSAFDNIARQEAIDKRFKENRTESQFKSTDRYLNNFSSSDSVKKAKSSIQDSGVILDLIESRQPITADQVAVFNARGLFNEVGRLSDDDVKRAGIPLDLWKRNKNNLVQFFKGDMDDDTRKVASRLLRKVISLKQEQLKTEVQTRGNAERAKRFGLKSDKDLQDMLKDELGGVLDTTKATNGVSASRALEILREVKAKKNKKGNK